MRFKLKIIVYWLRLVFASKLTHTKAIAVFQKKKLKKFAKETLSKSPFYAKYMSADGYNWDAVPLISKTEFMDNFDTINTLQIKKDEAMQIALEAEKTRDFKSEINGITVGLSTGTSGKRGLFLVSEDERAKWVALVMTRVVKPILFKKQKCAFFLRANSNLYTSVASRLFDFTYFDIFKPIDELLASLHSYQPHILAAPPSLLVAICTAHRKNKITIRPTQILSFAEVLHDNDKVFIEETFDSKIKEVYQCTEGFLGVSCAYGTMHLNEDFIHFEKEWIDEERFHPIVTDFSRHTQPVIKYRMNDILQIRKTPCPCGSHHLAIEKIIGRDDDVLLFGSIKIYPDLIARRIAIHTDVFHQYMIVQHNYTLAIYIDCELARFDEVKESFITTLTTLLEEHSVDVNMIKYSFKQGVQLKAGDKLRKIQRIDED